MIVVILIKRNLQMTNIINSEKVEVDDFKSNIVEECI